MKVVGNGISSLLWVARMWQIMWPLAGAYMCDVHNLTNTIKTGPLTGKMSYTAFTGEEIPNNLVFRDFGSEVTYVPEKLTTAKDDKVKPRAQVGLFMGYVMQPGGAWSGRYRIVPLEYFTNKDAKLRIYDTTDVRFPPEVTFPLKKLYDIQEAHNALVTSPYDNQRQLLQHIVSFGTRKDMGLRNSSTKSKVESTTEEEPEQGVVSIEDAAAVGDLTLDAPDKDEKPGGVLLDELPILAESEFQAKLNKTAPYGYHINGVPVQRYEGSDRPQLVPPEVWRILTEKQRKRTIKMETEDFEAALRMTDIGS